MDSSDDASEVFFQYLSFYNNEAAGGFQGSDISLFSISDNLFPLEKCPFDQETYHTTPPRTQSREECLPDCK